VSCEGVLWDLELKEGVVVLLGNNKVSTVQGMGSIRLKMFYNRKILLQKVRYVPMLKRNLFVNRHV